MKCHAPVFHKVKNSKSYQSFPCGKCQSCRGLRAASWTYRLLQEEKVSYSAYFITLTYDSNSVPVEAGKQVLRKSDLQKFFKRLRKMHSKVVESGKPIRYYAVGEYGGRFKRPHYHVIMFNARAELVDKCWKYGRVQFGDVCGASVGYTLKYISKPGKNEFSLMSKGIGEKYLTPTMTRWHNTVPAERCYVINDKGCKMPMPRYYRDRLYSKDEKKIIAHFASIDARRQEYGKTAYELFNENETKKFQLKKLGNVQKQSLVETPVQSQRVFERVREAKRTFSNYSRSNNAASNALRSVHARFTASFC